MCPWRKRECWIPWSWRYRCCEPLLWVLGIKLWSSARIASALNLWVISLAWPFNFFLFETVFQCSPGYPWTHYVVEDHWSFWSPCDLFSSVGIAGVHHQHCFMWCWDGTQGFVYTRQALYQLSYTSSPELYFYKTRSSLINSNETVSPIHFHIFIYWLKSNHTV